MPRINVEEEWFADPRREMLQGKINNPESVDSIAVRMWRLAQHYWIPAKELIPAKSWKGCDFPDAVFEVGLAERRNGGVYVSGTEKHFAWYFEKIAKLHDRAQKGGRARVRDAQRSSSGQLLPAATSDTSQTPAKPSPSSSSSSSFSSSEEKPKKKICGDKPRRLGDPRMNPLRDLWMRLWGEKYGVAPNWSGQEAKHAQGLLAYLDRVKRYDDLEVLFKRYLEDEDPIQIKNQHPFSTVAKFAHKYLTSKLPPVDPLQAWANGGSR